MSPLQDLSLRTGLDVARMFELYQDVRVKSLGNALGAVVERFFVEGRVVYLVETYKDEKGDRLHEVEASDLEAA